ncbi:hypothetical protein J6590_011776, partial [Homalodisca vitripennis]
VVTSITSGSNLSLARLDSTERRNAMDDIKMAVIAQPLAATKRDALLHDAKRKFLHRAKHTSISRLKK